MIHTRAQTGDVVRILVPNVDCLVHLPPGTTLVVRTYMADQPHSCLVEVMEVPTQPETYQIIVPKGAKVAVAEG